MKKIVITSLLILPLLSFIAQEEEGKKFRFGLMGNTSIGWLTPDDERKFSSGGVGLGLGWGLQMEFKLGKTTSFVTGLNLESYKASLNYDDPDLSATSKPTYYDLNSDFEYVSWEDLTDIPRANPDSNLLFQLTKRSYTINYVNIPLILKMKTKEIGYFTYFGEFGAVLGFKTKARVDDVANVVSYDSLSSDPFTIEDPNFEDNIDLDLAKGTQPIRAGIRVGGGAEYNISGTTSLFFSLHYNYFITNALTRAKSEDYLRSYDSDTGEFEAVGAKAIPGSVSLTVGILF